MNNFDYIRKKNIKEPNPNWLEIPDYQYRLLIIGGSASGKTISLFNLISHQQILIKFIDMIKIHMEQGINC